MTDAERIEVLAGKRGERAMIADRVVEKRTVEVALKAASGELTWEGYVDELRLSMSEEAARRLARHLLLRVDTGEGA